jgi:hypothetical protein
MLQVQNSSQLCRFATRQSHTRMIRMIRMNMAVIDRSSRLPDNKPVEHSTRLRIHPGSKPLVSRPISKLL